MSSRPTLACACAYAPCSSLTGTMHFHYKAYATLCYGEPSCCLLLWLSHLWRGKEGDISCLDATNFLFMHGAHTHYRHPHTIDRFIIMCQESAGCTYQQNGPIWAGVRPHPSSSHPSTYLVSTPLPLILPASQPTQPNPERHRIHVSVTSFVSAFSYTS